VFRLSDSMVVKFPMFPGICQTKQEIAVIERVRKDPRLSDLRPHVPEVYYADSANDLIVMKYYPEPMPTSMWEGDQHMLLRRKFLEIGVEDLHWNNVKIDNNVLIAIDLGCVPGELLPEND